MGFTDSLNGDYSILVACSGGFVGGVCLAGFVLGGLGARLLLGFSGCVWEVTIGVPGCSGVRS